MQAPRETSCIHTWWDALVVAVLGAWMLFAHLDGALFEPDESRYAEIPRLMLQSGDWVTPRLQGKPYNDKPPLVYWLIAGSYSLLGVSIESARLVPTCFGWLTLLVVYSWSRRYVGRGAAFLGAVVLLTMIGFVALTRMLLLDGVLTFFVVSALLAGHHALATGRRYSWWLLAALLCGGGILTKGPVALVLVGPCLWVLRWLDRTTTPMRIRDGVVFGIVAVAVAAPWYGAMLATNDTFGAEFFLRHHLQRYLAPAHHERPVWYYIPTLLLELMPWTFIALAGGARWRRSRGPERLLLVFSAWCFVFFSLARCKLPTYLLPMLPALAVIAGNQVKALLLVQHETRWLRHTVAGSVLGLLLVIAFRDVGVHVALQEGQPRMDPWALGVALLLGGYMTLGSLFERWVSTRSSGAPSGDARLSLWRYWIPFGERRRWLSWSAVGGAAWCVTLWACHEAIPAYAESTSVVPPCELLAARAEAEGIPVVAHRNSWDAVSFHLGRGEFEVYSSKEWEPFLAWLRHQPRCMVWMREGDGRLDRFVRSLPAELQVENVFDVGKVQALILRHAPEQRTATLPR